MSRLSVFAVLALGALSALAAPTSDNIALARKYAPQFKFHTSEIYWPSSVEYFLRGVKLTDAKGNVVNGAVSPTNIGSAPNQGSGLYLSTDINSGKGGFLRGQNPANSAPSVYTFIAPKDNGVVDLYYWLFAPYNQGKSVPLVGQVGDHVGDWERITVRTVNGAATSVDYHAHGDTGSGTIPWAQIRKFDNNQRPVAYVAKGSHGFWSGPGTFTYVNAVVFKLQDETSDGGVAWDTKDSLVNIRYPDSYGGDLGWLNFKGAWGNIGQTSCWWYVFHNECEIVTGPGGPVRDDVLGASLLSAAPSKGAMQGPLSQTLGTASTEATSSFEFYVDSSVFSLAGYTHLAVQQTCTSTIAPAEEGAEPATSTTSAVTNLVKGQKKFTVSPSACGANSSVTSYVVGVGADDTLAAYAWGAPRKLRAFSADVSVHGEQAATAVVVSDLDTWRW